MRIQAAALPRASLHMLKSCLVMAESFGRSLDGNTFTFGSDVHSYSNVWECCPVSVKVDCYSGMLACAKQLLEAETIP